MAQWIRSLSRASTGFSLSPTTRDGRVNDDHEDEVQELVQRQLPVLAEEEGQQQQQQQQQQQNGEQQTSDHMFDFEQFIRSHVHAFDVKTLVSYNLKKGRISRDVLVMTLIYNQKLTSLDAKEKELQQQKIEAQRLLAIQTQQSQIAIADEMVVPLAMAPQSALESHRDLNTDMCISESTFTTEANHGNGSVELPYSSTKQSTNGKEEEKVGASPRGSAMQLDENSESFGKLSDNEIPETRLVLQCTQCRFLGCLLLASKYTEDSSPSNRQWADSTRMPVSYLNKIERHLLNRLEFNLHVPGNLWNKWCKVVYAQVLSTMGFPTDPTAINMMNLNSQFSDTNTHDLIADAKKRLATYAAETGKGVIDSVASYLPATAHAYAAPVIATYFQSITQQQQQQQQTSVQHNSQQGESQQAHQYVQQPQNQQHMYGQHMQQQQYQDQQRQQLLHQQQIQYQLQLHQQQQRYEEYQRFQAQQQTQQQQHDNMSPNSSQQQIEKQRQS
eukprot:CFRG5441T1